MLSASLPLNHILVNSLSPVRAAKEFVREISTSTMKITDSIRCALCTTGRVLDRNFWSRVSYRWQSWTAGDCVLYRGCPRSSPAVSVTPWDDDVDVVILTINYITVMISRNQKGVHDTGSALDVSGRALICFKLSTNRRRPNMCNRNGRRGRIFFYDVQNYQKQLRRVPLIHAHRYTRNLTYSANR